MLKFKKNLLLIMLLVPVFNLILPESSDSCASSGNCGTISQNLWQPHAFSNYASREILIMKGLDLNATEGCWLNRVGFATEYMQSFNDDNCHGLGALPFWSGTNTMTIGNHDGKADLDAYQFGMGNVVVDPETGVGGTITLAPKIQHVGTELLWYGMQNNDKLGAYAKVKVPLGAMIVTSNLCENPAVETGAEITGYVAPVLYFPTLSASFHSGTNQQQPTFMYGKIPACKQTVIRIGDITAALGVNLVAREDALFGVGAKFSCPTGNVPNAMYALEPIFGRAGHWGVGGELFGQYTYHLSDAGCGAERSVRVWFQGEVMHLFNGREPNWRSFDLKANGKGSRYLFLQHYSIFVDGDSPDSVDAAINVTTFPVISTFGIEGNFSLMLDFKRDNWNLAIGGDFWGRSAECLSLIKCPLEYFDNYQHDRSLNHYAVLGRQTFDSQWCEPLARINESKDAYSGTGPIPAGIADGSIASNRIPADFYEALDICGAAARSIMTGKVLAELGYTWREHCHVPNLSIFGGAEFSRSNNNWPQLWSVGLQGSLQF